MVARVLWRAPASALLVVCALTVLKRVRYACDIEVLYAGLPEPTVGRALN